MRRAMLAFCSDLLFAAGEGAGRLPAALLQAGEQIIDPLFNILDDCHVREYPMLPDRLFRSRRCAV